MPVKLTEPHSKREHGNETIPLWRCPHCHALKTIQEFGFRFRRDAYKKVNMWQKQAWCTECRAKS
jgi:hypothetical protein